MREHFEKVEQLDGEDAQEQSQDAEYDGVHHSEDSIVSVSLIQVLKVEE